MSSSLGAAEAIAVEAMTKAVVSDSSRRLCEITVVLLWCLMRLTTLYVGCMNVM